MPIKKEKKQRPPKKAPAKVNNYLKNKPVVAQSKNHYPMKRKPRQVEEVKPVVNAKVADEKLIHKPAPVEPQQFIPVIEKGASKTATKKTSRKSSKI